MKTTELYANGIYINNLYAKYIEKYLGRKTINGNSISIYRDGNILEVARLAENDGDQQLMNIVQKVKSFEWKEFEQNTIYWTNSEGLQHRIDGPAGQCMDGSYTGGGWFVNGVSITELVQYCLVMTGFKPDTPLPIIAERMIELGDNRLFEIIEPYLEK